MKFVTRSLRSLANNFIFWLGKLIFSVSINSHYLLVTLNIYTDTSIFVFSREKLHDSKYSKDASPKP
jgi:hypothetical protein